ncbi:hypothetical protein GBAR_LOCUS15270 [Geodia barretti]|uniref:DSL domain-containing protein n=1 Tax=Geodia barretti TaxID=519541 RepID=A0AA35SAQ3_GEOBA|nr:hypothetical protein GBAR_LOCUS15270 [Geodia barretti]
MLFMSLQSLLELYVNITDYDSIGDNDTVDDITIPLSGRLEADSQFSLSKTYSGSCGRASLAVKFRLTSQYPTNQYGPQCDKECIEEPQQTLCNYLGESVGLCPNGFNGDTTECRCEGHFLESSCILCDDDYYPTGQCDVFCRPRDSDVRGHYRCNPETGEKVCLEGYKDPSTLCVDEDENHDGGSGSTAGAASGSVIAGLVILGCCILCCCLGGGSSSKKRHETIVVTTTRPTNLTLQPAVTQGTINPVVLDRKVFVLVTKDKE